MSASNDLHYVFVCQGKNCLGKGAKELLSRVRTALENDERFKVVPFICFGACSASPNIAVFPDRLWYSTVAPEHVEIVVQSILKTQEMPELARNVSSDLKNLVFRFLAKPVRA
jgi:sirohydrochlorin cobaltochelatase